MMHWFGFSSNFSLIISQSIASALFYFGVLLPNASLAQDIRIWNLSTPDWNRISPLDLTSGAFTAYAIVGEPLFHLTNSNGRLAPWLVEAFEPNADGRIWRLTLRDGVEWSDGEELNTDDVDFTFGLLLNSDTYRSPNAVNLRSQVASVSVQDERTFTVTLRKPNMRFPHDLLAARREGTFLILPRHVWEGNISTFAATPLGSGFLKPLLGSGPYVADSITATEVVLVRNQDWWGAKTGFRDVPEPERVVIRYIETDQEAIDALKADELDFGPEVDFETFTGIREANPNVIAWSATDPVPWLGQCPRQLDFNTISPPWDDAALRRAVAHFVDQTRIVDDAFGGQNQPSQTLFPALPGLQPYVDVIVASGFAMPETANPAQGDAEMVAAGYAKGVDGIYEKAGEDLSLTIHVADTPAVDASAAGVVAQSLTEAGIATEVEVVPADELWAWILPPGKFEAAYSWLGCGSVVDPYASLRRYHPNAAVDIGVRSPGYNNMARWNTPAAQRFGQIVDEMSKTAPGEPEVIDLTREAYELLAQEAPLVPLVQEPIIVPFNTSRWKGWPTADNPYAMPPLSWGQFQSIVHNLTASN
ncbi:ABC transporter substrate-binding protein [Paracoccus hibiscisoli]|nr:ABC transporter substrate-binding protein [Paracoccus hibiscisoli]